MDDEMKSSLFHKLKDIARAYQYPFYVFFVASLIGRIFFPIDVPEGSQYDCARCPVMPLTEGQENYALFMFVLGMVIPIWVALIAIRRRYERKGYW